MPVMFAAAAYKAGEIAAKPCDTCEAARDGQCYTLAARQPTVTYHRADGVSVVQIEIADQGTITPQHAHPYEHMTMLARGMVRVSCADAEPVEYRAPVAITIPRMVKHLFETLTPDVLLFCIHNTARTGEVQVAEEHQIVGGV